MVPALVSIALYSALALIMQVCSWPLCVHTAFIWLEPSSTMTVLVVLTDNIPLFIADVGQINLSHKKSI